MFKLRAKITGYPIGKGRINPIVSGYRPLFNFDGALTKISGQIELIDQQKLLPGDSGIVNIIFNEGIIDPKYFRKGEKFTFDEGIKETGFGEFLEIC